MAPARQPFDGDRKLGVRVSGPVGSAGPLMAPTRPALVALSRISKSHHHTPSPPPPAAGVAGVGRATLFGSAPVRDGPLRVRGASPLPRPISGLRTRTPRPAAAAAALIGAAAGFCLSYQQSAGRLMGFLPNDREVEVGLASKR